MSKSKKKNQKLEGFIPEGQLIEESQDLIVDVSQIDTSVADENSGQAEAIIGDEMDEANKTSPAIHDETKVIDPADPRHVYHVEEKGPQKNLSAKPMSWAERLEARNAERARRQEEWQQKIQNRKEQMQGK